MSLVASFLSHKRSRCLRLRRIKQNLAIDWDVELLTGTFEGRTNGEAFGRVRLLIAFDCG